MVLSKEELLEALRHETQILVHLAGKADPSMHDYRPTKSQRSMFELLRYMAIMGPLQISLIKDDGFNGPALRAAWSEGEKRSQEMTWDQAVEAIRAQADEYDRLLGDWTDADWRGEIDMFGRRVSRGKTVVTLVLNAHAAYRTQLFCYLKACGREELGTMNLWGGVDPPARSATDAEGVPASSGFGRCCSA